MIRNVEMCYFSDGKEIRYPALVDVWYALQTIAKLYGWNGPTFRYLTVGDTLTPHEAGLFSDALLRAAEAFELEKDQKDYGLSHGRRSDAWIAIENNRKMPLDLMAVDWFKEEELGQYARMIRNGLSLCFPETPTDLHLPGYSHRKGDELKFHRQTT